MSKANIFHSIKIDKCQNDILDLKEQDPLETSMAEQA